MLDLRLVKTYSNAGPLEDAAFIRDTIYTKIANQDYDDGETSEKLRDLEYLLETKRGWNSMLEICRLAAGVFLTGKMTFRQTFTIARILGCDGKDAYASRYGGEAQPELNSDKLLDHIKKLFSEEWKTVSEGKRQPSSAMECTIVGDATTLKTHLENLHARKNETAGLQNIGDNVEKTLISELKEKHDRRPCLNLAVFHNYPECLRVLLEYAVKDGSDTFKKVMKQEDGFGYSPCSFAIGSNNLECIMEIFRGGFDFFGLNITESDSGHRISAFAYMVIMASKDPEKYLENFKIILSELQQHPKFNVNVSIPYERDRIGSMYERHSLRRRLQHLRMYAELGLPLPPHARRTVPGHVMDLGIDEEDEYISLGEGEAEEDVEMNADAAWEDIDIANILHAEAGIEHNNEEEGEEEEIEDERDGGDAAGEEEEEQGEEGENMNRATSLLKLAARHGGVEVLKLLLDLGANPEDAAFLAAVKYIGSCIDRAACSEDVRMPNVAAGMSMLQALLGAGVDINAEHPETKDTALHMAAGRRCHEVLSFLLERGANSGKLNGDGQTAAEIAALYDDTAAVDILTSFARLQRLSSFNRSASQNERRESQEQSEIPDELACVACLQRKKEVILAPCGHKVLCRTCTKRLLTRPEVDRKCPMCRNKLESFVVQVFES